jgi:hypothetical protein
MHLTERDRSLARSLASEREIHTHKHKLSHTHPHTHTHTGDFSLPFSPSLALIHTNASLKLGMFLAVPTFPTFFQKRINCPVGHFLHDHPRFCVAPFAPEGAGGEEHAAQLSVFVLLY